MAWGYTQNFDALNTAALHGQDSWSTVGSGADITVQTSTVLQGVKSVKGVHKANSTNTVRTGFTADAIGAMSFLMQRSSAAAGGATYFILKNGVNNGRCYVTFDNAGNVKAYNNDASPAYDTISTYVANTTYTMRIDYNTTTGKYDVYQDGVLKANQFTMLNSGTLDTINIDLDAGAGVTVYFDAIQPYVVPTNSAILVMF